MSLIMSLAFPKAMVLPSIQRLSLVGCFGRMQCLRQIHHLKSRSCTPFQTSAAIIASSGRPLKNILKSPCDGTIKSFRFLTTQTLTRLRTLPVENGFYKITFRQVSGQNQSKSNKTAIIYITAIGIFMVGAAYAGVPLYRIFCQASGLGGQAVAGHDASKVATMVPIKDRQLTVKFNADTASSMQWNFRPQQSEVKIIPGETALAFYTARNPTDKAIIGISTYNVVPFEAGQYFNKIQCFCFEEQRLNPHEQVDMPVFFYIDPEFAEDPKLANVDMITLSYTFFEAKEGLNLPLPGYVQPTPQPT